jgi:simple sugar transport system permease protein
MTDFSAVGDVLLAVLGGAIRVGTPFLFVSLGECLTEKSGRINLGLEGVLVFSAMAGFGLAYLRGLWWVGVLAAGLAGALLALLHGLMASLPRVNDIAAVSPTFTANCGAATQDFFAPVSMST